MSETWVCVHQWTCWETLNTQAWPLGSTQGGQAGSGSPRAGTECLSVQEDHLRVEKNTSASTLISLHLPPSPPPPPQLLPVLMEGKNFQLFPSLFFQTDDSLRRGIPPSPIPIPCHPMHRCHRSGPSCCAGTVMAIFGCFMGVAPQGRGCGGASAASFQSPSPFQVPPHPHPSSGQPGSGRREGSLLSPGINNSGGYSALRT